HPEIRPAQPRLAGIYRSAGRPLDEAQVSALRGPRAGPGGGPRSGDRSSRVKRCLTPFAAPVFIDLYELRVLGSKSVKATEFHKSPRLRFVGEAPQARGYRMPQRILTKQLRLFQCGQIEAE